MVNIKINPLWELYYNGKYSTLYDCSKETKGLAYCKWFGFFDLNDLDFIKEMRKSLDFIKDRRIITIISDHSGLKSVPQESMEWIQKNWYPTAYKNGLRIEACLLTDSAIANMSINRMMKNESVMTGKINTPSFKSFEDAIKYCTEYLNKSKK